MAQQVSQQAGGPQAAPSTAELIDRLSRFDGPPELFLVNLLAVQCHLAAAEGGAVLRAVGPSGQPEVLAIYPPLAEGAALPVWLAQAVESTPAVAAEGVTATKPVFGSDDMYGQSATRHLVMVPLLGAQGVRGLTAFTIAATDAAVLAASRERLEITVSLLSLYEMRLTLQQRQLDFQRLRLAMEVLSAINEHTRFTGAAMAVCNEAAARWRADRVSLGFLKGRYVQVKSTSHTEKFSRKMKLIQDIESAMEECFDQDVEILHPAPQDATHVSRAAGDLSRHHGPSTVLSLPLRRAGEVVAVLTVERPADVPFELEEVESLRLTGELCTARLAGLFENDRWFGARMAATARRGLSVVLGPKHTWLKVAAIVVFGAIVFLTLAKGQYRVGSPFVLEAVTRRVVPAPYEGTVAGVEVKPGDWVEAGQQLARLDTVKLAVELGGEQAKRSEIINKIREADKAGRRADKRVAEAQRKQVDANIRRLETEIGRAELEAPCEGYVLAGEMGDLNRLIGAPVNAGTVLFMVTPIATLRAEMSVPEDRIGDVIQALAKARKDGRLVTGELATASEPDRRIAFVVERVIPVAEVADQQNTFKVWVTLEDVDLLGEHSWMRPGLEGSAKIDIDRRRYAWIWTRKLTNWLRMKLWL